MAAQLKLPEVDNFYLAQRISESQEVVSQITAESEKPLVIQFSGGRDSMALIGIVREVTDHFVCAYMCSGLEFQGELEFVSDACEKYGLPLVVSYPSMHKGDFFERMERFEIFPGLGSWGNGGSGSRTWCNRDLKVRPQTKMLKRVFGRGTFYKLEGIRRFESGRRRSIYRPYKDYSVRPDSEQQGSFEVFPLINWTDADVLNYLEISGFPTQPRYKRYGVTGCAWCPFYESEIYKRVLADDPNYYDRFIEWEDKLNKPCVLGNVWMGDLKKEALAALLVGSGDEST